MWFRLRLYSCLRQSGVACGDAFRGASEGVPFRGSESELVDALAFYTEKPTRRVRQRRDEWGARLLVWL
jgi:hypothetical protein